MKCTVVYEGKIKCENEEDEPIYPEDVEEINEVWRAPGYEVTLRDDGTAGTCNEHLELMGEI